MVQITFSSDKFLPYLPEHCQVNPGAYGFELAHWLSHVLAQAGISTSYPAAKDWGWFLESLDGETEIMIGCGSEAEEGEGYLGKPITWRVLVKPSRSVKPWFQGKVAPVRITPLTEAIIAVLKAEGIVATVEAT